MMEAAEAHHRSPYSCRDVARPRVCHAGLFALPMHGQPLARYKLVPVASGRYVMSPTYFTLGAEAVKSRLAHSRSQATS